MYPTIAYRLGVLSPDRWILGGLAILLILEATRRIAGWGLVWCAVPCILYAKFAYLFPGLLYAKGSSWERIATYLYLDASGILGLPLERGGKRHRGIHLFWPGPLCRGRGQVPDRCGPKGHGTISRRRRQGLGSFLCPLWHRLGKRGGQRGGGRRHHHPDDEAHRLPSSCSRGDRGGGVKRRADHAAGDGRGGFSHRRISQYFLWPGSAGRRDSCLPLLLGPLHPGRPGSGEAWPRRAARRADSKIPEPRCGAAGFL